jgi:hypothetical protein
MAPAMASVMAGNSGAKRRLPLVDAPPKAPMPCRRFWAALCPTVSPSASNSVARPSWFAPSAHSTGLMPPSRAPPAPLPLFAGSESTIPNQQGRYWKTRGTDCSMLPVRNGRVCIVRSLISADIQWGGPTSLDIFRRGKWFWWGYFVTAAFLFILWFVGGSRRLLGTAQDIVFILRFQINDFRIYGFALHTK